MVIDEEDVQSGMGCLGKALTMLKKEVGRELKRGNLPLNTADNYSIENAYLLVSHSRLKRS